jgi:methionine biosynthesis protein MetW
MIRKLAKLGHDIGKRLDKENRRAILNLVKECAKINRILDLGCGDDEFTQEIGKNVGSEELYGIEISEKFGQLAKNRGVKVILADLNKPLPIKAETFDLVIANQVIEHLHETDLFIKEIFRVLKWDGRAVISTPNLATIENIIFLILGLQPITTFVSDEVYVGNPFHPKYMRARTNIHPGHLRIFTLRSLKELFEFHGFIVEKIIGVGYYLPPPPISQFFSKISPCHSAYLTMRCRKEQN